MSECFSEINTKRKIGKDERKYTVINEKSIPPKWFWNCFWFDSMIFYLNLFLESSYRTAGLCTNICFLENSECRMLPIYFFSFWPFSWNCGYPASDVQLITRRELLDAKSFHSNREMGLNWRLQAWNEHRLNSLVLDFFHSDLTAYVSITVFSNF